MVELVVVVAVSGTGGGVVVVVTYRFPGTLGDDPGDVVKHAAELLRVCRGTVGSIETEEES